MLQQKKLFFLSFSANKHIMLTNKLLNNVDELWYSDESEKNNTYLRIILKAKKLKTNKVSQFNNFFCVDIIYLYVNVLI